jgi:hypothetical protein
MRLNVSPYDPVVNNPNLTRLHPRRNTGFNKQLLSLSSRSKNSAYLLKLITRCNGCFNLDGNKTKGKQGLETNPCFWPNPVPVADIIRLEPSIPPMLTLVLKGAANETSRQRSLNRRSALKTHSPINYQTMAVHVRGPIGA